MDRLNIVSKIIDIKDSRNPHDILLVFHSRIIRILSVSWNGVKRTRRTGSRSIYFLSRVSYQIEEVHDFLLYFPFYHRFYDLFIRSFC